VLAFTWSLEVWAAPTPNSTAAPADENIARAITVSMSVIPSESETADLKRPAIAFAER
jgi:hypothetical protein